MTTQSWQSAFDETQGWWPIVLQHLLLGVNAHINLDLGVAVVGSVPAEELSYMKSDFDKINRVLASLVVEVQQQLAEIWLLLGLLNRYLGNVDNVIRAYSGSSITYTL